MPTLTTEPLLRDLRYTGMTQELLTTTLLPSSPAVPMSVPPSLSAMGMVDLDATLFVSSAVFVMMMVLLHVLLFKPYLAILHERARLTIGAHGEASEAGARAKAVLTEYESKLDGARRDAAGVREGLRSSGLADEARIVGSAREQAQASLQARRSQLAAAVVGAEAQIDQRSTALAQTIVAKVLS